MKNKITWDDITLLDYINIQSIIESDGEDLDKSIKLLNIITKEDVENLPVNDFVNLSNYLKLLNTPVHHNKIKDKIIIDNKVWKVSNKIQKITTGQFLDYQNLCKEKITLENISKVIAYLLVPENGKYNVGYDMDELCAAIEREMSITDVYGFSDFFVKAVNQSLKVLVDCFNKAVIHSNMTLKQKITIYIAMKKNMKNLQDLLNMD